MIDTDSIVSNFPLTEGFKKDLEKISKSSHFRVILLSNLIDILSKNPKTQEEAASLFHQATPLAKMFKEASKS